MEQALEKIKKCCNEQELMALARLIELHINFASDEGLSVDEYREYEGCINEVGAILPVY